MPDFKKLWDALRTGAPHLDELSPGPKWQFSGKIKKLLLEHGANSAAFKEICIKSIRLKVKAVEGDAVHFTLEMYDALNELLAWYDITAMRGGDNADIFELERGFAVYVNF